MNDGADAGDGHIVGVIHEMFIVDGNDWYCKRDGGAHRLFQNKLDNTTTKGGPRRDILVAGGKDLQERKRLLVKDANGLIVLPGGPGTWDEVSPESILHRSRNALAVLTVCLCLYYRLLLLRLLHSCGKCLVSATWA
jgi:predicted Rossmann-fold nucleotide-binding protein